MQVKKQILFMRYRDEKRKIMKVKLMDGTIKKIEDVNWINVDRNWQEKNKKLLNDSDEWGLNYLAFAKEEEARLEEKLFNMRKLKIKKILDN